MNILSIKKSECTGCTACVNICPKHCIDIQENELGFFYPVPNSTNCIDCEQCLKVCPIYNKAKTTDALSEAFAAITNDSEVRMNSSSGGIFSELARIVLETRGIVYGAAYDNNFMVHHIAIRELNELNKLQGAKYAQSNLNKVFQTIKENLEENKGVLFCGTPCQIAGLKWFLKKEYSNLYCVDFICHGVPSPAVWQRFLEYVGLSNNIISAPISINLRNKESGWSNYSYSHRFDYPNQNVVFVPNKKSVFMSLFVKDYITRESCSNCKFKGQNRLSDISLGDFWGVWELYPELDDNKGVSAVIVNTKKGLELFDSLKDRIEFKRITVDEIVQFNPSYYKSAESKTKNKNKIVNKALAGDFKYIEKYFNGSRYKVYARSFKEKIHERLKNR